MDDSVHFATRVTALQQRSVTLKEHSKQMKQRLAQLHLVLETEMTTMQQELATLEDTTQAVVRQATVAVTHCKTVMKRADFERLHARVDAWGPEKWISRNAFLRLLK